MDATTGRLFLCARCRAQVVLCTRCDRGNVYCGSACSQAMRRASMRAAGRRYQHSRAGRFAHAQRARRYRLRRKNVTHQGSAAQGRGDLLPAQTTRQQAQPVAQATIEPRVNEGTPSMLAATTESARCSRCGEPRAHSVRQGWLRRGRRRIAAAWIKPPWRPD
jgi:hypothetical protein